MCCAFKAGGLALNSGPELCPPWAVSQALQAQTNGICPCEIPQASTAARRPEDVGVPEGDIFPTDPTPQLRGHLYSLLK